MSKKSTNSGFGTVLRAAAAAVLVAGLAAGAAVAQERIYVANTGETSVSVIDPSTNTLATTGGSLVNAIDLGASPDGRRVYVTDGSQVGIIDTTFNVVTVTVPIPNGAGLIAVNPNGKFVYVLEPFGTHLTVLNTDFPPSIVRQLALNAITTGIAVSPDGRLLYVTDVVHSSLKIMSTSNFASIDVPLASPFLEAVAVHPDDRHVYVSDAVADVVSVVDILTGSVTTIPVSNPTRLAVTPDGATLYVVNGPDNTVTAIATATNVPFATIPVGVGPTGIAVAATGGYVYVANRDSDSISVIITATNTVIATIAVGDMPVPVVDVVRRGPGSKSECMNGGWQNLTNPSFRTQGECIAFYNSIH